MGEGREGDFVMQQGGMGSRVVGLAIFFDKFVYPDGAMQRIFNSSIVH